MAERSWSSEALILSVKNFGEGHRTAMLLLPETGHSCRLLEAAVFGGPKSRLRGLVVPFQSGRIWLYSNPAKNTNKITDFKVTEYRMGLRESLMRLWCASFASELASLFKGNVDWNTVNFFLTGIAGSSDAGCKTALLRFLWRTVIFSGIAPDTESCLRCGKKIDGLGTKEEHTTPSAAKTPKDYSVKNGLYTDKSSVLFYLPHEDACACKNCTYRHERTFPLSSESLFYLSAVRNLPPKHSRNLGICENTYCELKHFLFYLTQAAAGKTFKTLSLDTFLL